MNRIGQPNIGHIIQRTPEATALRKTLSDEHCALADMDFSAIELRVLVHYPGSREALLGQKNPISKNSQSQRAI